MARGLITEHVRSRKLANGPIVWDDGDPVNGHSMDNASQDKTLMVWNTDAGNQTVEVPKRLTADGDAFEQDILTIAANGVYAFDYFENEYYGWDDGDNDLTSETAVIVNVSDASVKLAVLPAGNRATIIA